MRRTQFAGFPAVLRTSVLIPSPEPALHAGVSPSLGTAPPGSRVRHHGAVCKLERIPPAMPDVVLECPGFGRVDRSPLCLDLTNPDAAHPVQNMVPNIEAGRPVEGGLRRPTCAYAIDMQVLIRNAPLLLTQGRKQAATSGRAVAGGTRGGCSARCASGSFVSPRPQPKKVG